MYARHGREFMGCKSPKDILRFTIDRLKTRLREIESEIKTIKESDTFQTITNIEDWDDYFNKTKEELKIELEELKIENDSELNER